MTCSNVTLAPEYVRGELGGFIIWRIYLALDASKKRFCVLCLCEDTLIKNLSRDCLCLPEMLPSGTSRGASFDGILPTYAEIIQEPLI